MANTSKSMLAPPPLQATLTHAEKHTEAPYQPVLCQPLPSQASRLNLSTQTHIEPDDAVSKAEIMFYHARVELARQRRLACSNSILNEQDFIFEDTIRRKNTLLDLFRNKRNLMIIYYAETVYENLFDVLASYLFPHTSLARVSSSLSLARSFIPCYTTNSALFTTPGITTYHLSCDGSIRRVAMAPFMDFFSLPHLLEFVGDFEEADETDRMHSTTSLENADEKVEMAENDDEAVVNAVVRWMDLIRDLETKETMKGSVGEKESKKKKKS